MRFDKAKDCSIQFPDGNLYWEAGIVYCSCGRCLRMSRNDKEVDKSNNDAVSIPGNVIKKNHKRGARHGPSDRQRIYNKAREMLHKAGQKEHGQHSTSMRDGSAAKDSESRGRTMDGRRATSWTLTKLPWKIINTLRQELSEFVTQNIGF